MPSATGRPSVLADLGSGTAWTLPAQNVLYAVDGAYAEVSLLGETSSKVLIATGFGFAIPAGATIDGVELGRHRYASGNDVQSASLWLYVDGVAGGDAGEATDWPLVLTEKISGDASDLWGIPDLSVAQVNAATFGCAIQVQNMSLAARTAYLDQIELTVHYTEAGEDGPVSITAPTVTEVIEEGQFKRSYFPRTADTQALMDSMITARINDSVSWIRLRMGSTAYAAATGDTATQATTAILYLTCSKLWQIVKNVMDAYDEETLPPEYVEPEQAAANRDYYREMAMDLIGLVDTADPNDALTGFAKPYFNAVGTDEDTGALLDAWLEAVE